MTFAELQGKGGTWRVSTYCLCTIVYNKNQKWQIFSRVSHIEQDACFNFNEESGQFYISETIMLEYTSVYYFVSVPR